ncbi:MAG: hypothetical protein N3G75_07175 [Methanothrix sp.]|nr:hypothetical protein [Methanothrix sp.]MCX8207599.1 hypothetical protein [Methanothrix sp.]
MSDEHHLKMAPDHRRACGIETEVVGIGGLMEFQRSAFTGSMDHKSWWASCC